MPKEGPFNKAQNEAIREHFVDWSNFAFVKCAGESGRGSTAKLTKWKQDRANTIIKHPSFKEYPPGYDHKQTLLAIVRKFTNYRNAQKTKNIDKHSEELTALKNSATYLSDMMAYSKGRDLFKQERHTEITKRKTELMLSGEVSSSLGAYQRALKELWDEADRDEWEKKASDLRTNVHENQKQLSPNLFTGLRGLTQGGALGYLEMLVFYAHRDQNGRVVSSLLEVHHDDDVDHLTKTQKVYADVDAFQLGFETWADTILPESKKPPIKLQSVTLPRSPSGLPLFPEINMGQEPPDSLRKVISSYLEYVWEHCDPGDFSPPWDVIAKCPYEYYDMDCYPLTQVLDDPSRLTNSEIYQLATCLSQLSPPFEFMDADLQDKETTETPMLQFSPSHSEHGGPSSSHSKQDEVIRVSFTPEDAEKTSLPRPSQSPPYSGDAGKLPSTRRPSQLVGDPQPPSSPPASSSIPPQASVVLRAEKAHSPPSLPSLSYSGATQTSTAATPSLTAQDPLPASGVRLTSSKPSPPPSTQSPPCVQRSKTPSHELPPRAGTPLAAQGSPPPAPSIVSSAAEPALPSSHQPQLTSEPGSGRNTPQHPATGTEASHHHERVELGSVGATTPRNDSKARRRVKKATRSVASEDTEGKGDSEEGGVTRASRTTRSALKKAVPAQDTSIGGVNKKRSIAEIGEGTEVELVDGRKGIIKLSTKHRGVYFYQRTPSGEPVPKRQRVWFNEDQFEEQLRYPLVDDTRRPPPNH